jgi:hypothetical protein
LSGIEQRLFAGLQTDLFQKNPQGLFKLRIALAEIVAQANLLELQSRSGSAHLLPDGRGVTRRMREAAFIPIVTPSVLQLKLAIARQQKKEEVSS